MLNRSTSHARVDCKALACDDKIDCFLSTEKLVQTTEDPDLIVPIVSKVQKRLVLVLLFYDT